ncbi:Polyvinylalcohol dehydrogenase precursor [Tsuneonella dongtanensis]|uniref:Polyvinylalcohol dehydrogenase n=1 Tax=Tsuneonella dongtanensis TaxID=692370 RepID=A0A1B2AG70_9SPHN|nr:PQQ-binding-like beta-propeller repeat protein [Tsuneonella dongtanensis]ANY21134.1 Polyvinylalcohol dehydrogenase precursor [Tsuneonella dongtanensis]
MPRQIITAIIAMCALVACSRAPAGDETTLALAPSGQDAFAERLYKENCAACHDKGIGGAPKRAALEARTPAFIKQALFAGVMKAQGAAMKPAEAAILAEYLGRNARPAQASAGPKCDKPLRLTGAPLWNRWGNGLANTRFQPAAAAGLEAGNIGELELAWAFGFPDAQRARSQPAVTREAIFTGSQSGRVYALDTATGCVHWTFDAAAEVRNAPVIGAASGGKSRTLYFADFAATVYALDAATGKELWRKSVKDHPDATTTGSLALHAGILYVPNSSTEVISAFDDSYACCTFRGGVTALSASDGRKLWRWYATDPPKPAGRNSAGATIMAPSGAPVWSTPTVDAKRGLLYVGTGENYTSPANGNSDAIVALDLKSGKPNWVRQVTPGDAWNAACGRQPGANCPSEDGPDFDFGAPPILVKLASGKDMILAGQKSGMIYGIDPEAGGKVIWQQRAGMGGFNGGVHWGMASDGRSLWVGIADTPGNKYAEGPPQPGLHAFDAATGKPLWSRIEKPTCGRPEFACAPGLSAPLTAIPGVIFAGAHNGRLIAYSASDGRPLWSSETNKSFATVNGVSAKGGTIDGQGPVVAGGMVIVNSGYDKFGEIAGNVLLVYRRKGDS